GVDVREDLEFARAAHVVAVTGGTVGDDALAALAGAHLAGLERLDEPMLGGHATNPVIGLDAHVGLANAAKVSPACPGWRGPGSARRFNYPRRRSSGTRCCDRACGAPAPRRCDARPRY